MTDFDERYATKDKYGNITAKNQNGVDAKGRPLKVFIKPWRFGDSTANIKPTKII